MLDRFGGEIEFDLFSTGGWDVLDFVRGRRPWRQLERILARMPRDSHYRAALDDDDEYAELITKFRSGEESEKTPKVPLVGYSEVALRLDNLFDAVNAVRETLMAVYSKKNSKPSPVRAKRPETAMQRAARQKSMTKLQSIEERMLGGR
jgi:hypothetical protein